jgi:hypothetical protein
MSIVVGTSFFSHILLDVLLCQGEVKRRKSTLLPRRFFRLFDEIQQQSNNLKLQLATRRLRFKQIAISTAVCYAISPSF